MSASPTPRKINPLSLGLIDEINVRQDEVLLQLDELNKEIENLIELCIATAKREAGEVDDGATDDGSTVDEAVAGSIDIFAEQSNPEEFARERGNKRAA